MCCGCVRRYSASCRCGSETTACVSPPPAATTATTTATESAGGVSAVTVAARGRPHRQRLLQQHSFTSGATRGEHAHCEAVIHSREEEEKKEKKSGGKVETVREPNEFYICFLFVFLCWFCSSLEVLCICELYVCFLTGRITLLSVCVKPIL